jgi:hypothetical protein
MPKSPDGDLLPDLSEKPEASRSVGGGRDRPTGAGLRPNPERTDGGSLPDGDASTYPTRIAHVPPALGGPALEEDSQPTEGAGPRRDEIPNLAGLAAEEIEASQPRGPEESDPMEDSLTGARPLETPVAESGELDEHRPPRPLRRPIRISVAEVPNFSVVLKKVPSRAWMFCGVVGVLILLIWGGLSMRAAKTRQSLAEGQAQALAQMRQDTYQGFRAAADLLEPLAQLDPHDAAALRAFALAMLYADYRDEKRAAEAESLLAPSERADKIPPHAYLARAALAMGKSPPEAGSALSAASQAGDLPWAHVLQGRVALLAGNLGAARDAAAAALKHDAEFPAALAIQGDAARRERAPEAALVSYRAALKDSPRHPRSAFGMAKLALAGKAPAPEAEEPLAAILSDREATPGNERARAALHLSALRGRRGDRTGAAEAIDQAGLDPVARAWVEKAAGQEELERDRYRALPGAPAAAVSASDDDPVDPRAALAPARPAPPEKAAQAAPVKKGKKMKAAKPSKKKKKAKKAPAKRRRR